MHTPNCIWSRNMLDICFQLKNLIGKNKPTHMHGAEIKMASTPCVRRKRTARPAWMLDLLFLWTNCFSGFCKYAHVKWFDGFIYLFCVTTVKLRYFTISCNRNKINFAKVYNVKARNIFYNCACYLKYGRLFVSEHRSSKVHAMVRQILTGATIALCGITNNEGRMAQFSIDSVGLYGSVIQSFFSKCLSSIFDQCNCKKIYKITTWICLKNWLVEFSGGSPLLSESK